MVGRQPDKGVESIELLCCFYACSSCVAGCGGALGRHIIKERRALNSSSALFLARDRVVAMAQEEPE